MTVAQDAGTAEIRLIDLEKRFGAIRAVDGVSLEVRPGEFLCLLGPSGCGKTTTLRMIGGFELPTAGRILRDDLEMPVARLPERIADLQASACGTLVITSDGSTLVVDATGASSALLLGEQPSCEGMLTPRERDVMGCVEDGLSNAEIARKLWIQPTTVRKHLENIFAKLGVRSRTAALSKLQVSRAKAS